MAVSAGRRRDLIVIERASVMEDDYGHERPSEWTVFAEEFAEVRFGKADERRVAAQEQASVAATFGVLDNDKTRAVEVTDRIQFDGAAWNIRSNVRDREGGGRELTAIRDA